MKKIIIATLCTFSCLISSFVYAGTQENKKTEELKLETVKGDNVVLTLELGDITNLSKSELTNIISEKLEILNSFDDELTCTISVKGEINLGPLGSLAVEVTVSGPCSEVKKEGKALAEGIIADIREGLTS